MTKAEILIEGFRPEDLLSLEDLEGFALAGRPIVFSVGSAEAWLNFRFRKTC